MPHVAIRRIHMCILRSPRITISITRSTIRRNRRNLQSLRSLQSRRNHRSRQLHLSHQSQSLRSLQRHRSLQSLRIQSGNRSGSCFAGSVTAGNGVGIVSRRTHSFPAFLSPPDWPWKMDGEKMGEQEQAGNVSVKKIMTRMTWWR